MLLRGIDNLPVIDIADITSRVRSAWPLAAQEMQDPYSQAGMLAVLNKLTKMSQSALLRFRILLNDRNNRISNGGLVLQPSFIPQHRREEIHQNSMLSRELQRQRFDRLNDDNFKLVRNFTDERRNLLHEPVHGALRARLQQRGDRQGGNGPVRVRDEVLQVQVAGRDGGRVGHGHLVQGADGREPDGRLRAGA